MEFGLHSKWIGSGCRNDRKNSLPPELFRRKLQIHGDLHHAELNITAILPDGTTHQLNGGQYERKEEM